MPKEFMVDFSELRDFEAVPVGMYVLEVLVTGDEKVEYGQAKGTPYIRLAFGIVEPEEYVGQRVWQNFMLQGGGTRLTADLLRALGYEVQRGTSFRFPLYDIKGYKVVAKLIQTEYNGRIRNEVSAFAPYTKDDEVVAPF